MQSNDIKMTARSLIGRIVQQEDINFLLTNCLPRRWLTQFVGWLSGIEHPWVCAVCMSLWRVFSDLDLRDAKQSRFKSLHECFTRELKVGARPIETDPALLASPCDAIVGACGRAAATGAGLQGPAVPRQRRGNRGEHRHAHGDAVVDLLPDNRAWTVGDLR